MDAFDEALDVIEHGRSTGQMPKPSRARSDWRTSEMPVMKYRSIADMPRPPVRTDVDLAERIRAVWKRAFLVCPPTPPRGVTKFRTLEEANAHRERITLDRMRAHAR